ncbi:unnamed protein product [Ilex paraguariensis]|uniref:Uncharacterized protein n=1 Tax=Ilex paraguariensis TaxID=185542 RepID=A0ABC8RQG0_9AQUA
MSIPQISATESDVLMALLLRNKQWGVVPERGSMTAQHFRYLLRLMKRRLLAFTMDHIDFVKIIFFWKKQYFTIKAMLKTRMFSWGSADLYVIDRQIAGVRDYVVANKFARIWCIDPCPLFEKMMEIFDNMSPEELIERVGSCSGGDPAEDIEVINVFD